MFGVFLKALILAAGYATRMYPLTKTIPKPLLDVRGKPMIEHILRKIEEVREVEKIYIITNEKFFSAFKKWVSSVKFKKPVEVLSDGSKSDEERLGALGDIKYAIDEKRIDEELLAVGGDNLFEFSLGNFLRAYREKGASIVAFYDLHALGEMKKFGVALLDKQGRIIDFEEKPEKPKSTLAATCIYLFTRADLKLLGKYLSEGNSPDRSGNFIQWLHKKKPVYGFVFDSAWFDIGSFEGLEIARKEFKG